MRRTTIQRLVLWLTLVAAVAATAGCGSSSSTKSTTSTSSTKTAAKTTTSKSGTSKKSASKKNTCDQMGINLRQGKTGTCLKNGSSFTLVNSNGTLKVGDESIKLRKTSTTGKVTGALGKADPGKDGTFVVVELKVRNDGKRSARFDRKQKQVRLRVAGGGVPESFPAETAIAGTFVNANKKIAPGKSQTASVVFRLPSDKAKVLDQRGADGQILFFTARNAAAKNKPPDGAIRLWQ